MRLVRLSVQRFQCIERAELDFGRHLNVLYGPNDLGKSSLAWAIRAVLLLQHNQAQHARFVSWNGGGEPHVELTFCDDDERYWRVKKTFGTSAGRSILESSKDGRIFTSEASAREVDKRLRELLRWGLPAPGGKGPHGISESFLTQVLLAEQAQESVRKVLFESSLEGDDDPSGRARLTQALGALAQDPVFKKVLDQAQPFVDRAFTATGRKKKSAGSPFLETAERIKDLQHERDDLETKTKECAMVEARIVQLHGERDGVVGLIEDAAKAVADGQRRLATRRQREALHNEHQALLAKVNEVEELTQQIASTTETVAVLGVNVEAAALAVTAAAGASTHAQSEWDQGRSQLDALTHDDAEAVRREAGLRSAVASAEEQCRISSQRLAAARTALHAATATAQQVKDAIAASARADIDSKNADHADQLAGAAYEEVRQALADACERLREAKSGDRAQARELQRKELENRILALAPRRAQVEAGLRRAEEVGTLTAAAVAAEKDARATAKEVEVARKAVVADEEALAKVAAARYGLAQIEVYARHRETRDQIARATAATDAATRERDRAETLRAQASRLQADLRPNLPPVERIATLRTLHEDLRVAEASLGGGLSAVVRPRRPVELRLSHDGGAVSVQTAAEPITLAATSALVVQVDDLLDLEVTAGEASARQAAAELRARWLRDGAAVLVEHGVASVEELEKVRARTDNVAQQIASLTREADEADRHATQLSGSDLDALRDALAAVEAELGGADREELALRFARLGEPWQAGFRRQQTELDAMLETRRGQLERRREAATRLEAQLEAKHAEVERLQVDVARLQAELTEPWSSAIGVCKTELAQITDEGARLDAQLRAATSGESDEATAAAAAVATAQQALATAEDLARRRQNDAIKARDAMVQAATRLDSSRRAARDLDVAGAWNGSLEAGDGDLSLDAWNVELRDAERADVATRQDRSNAVGALEEALATRDAAIQHMRKQLQIAEASARTKREASEAALAEHRRLVDAHAKAQVALGEMRLEIASANLDERRRQLGEIREQIGKLGPDTAPISEESVAALERELSRQTARRGDLDEALAKARGALEQVGGAIMRERLQEIDQAIQRAKDKEREIEVEYAAWQLLVTTLRETESTESAHLGRALTGPVSERFRQLTGGRYGALELGTHLAAEGVHVAGEVREIGALSAGTQDQLATLLRLCIAEQLRSAIVLDDHLSQSDPARVAWFNTVLREASEKVQIVLLTCRPAEVLTTTEMTAAGNGSLTSSQGTVHAVNLSTVIHRFGAAARPAAVPASDGDSVSPRRRS